MRETVEILSPPPAAGGEDEAEKTIPAGLGVQARKYYARVLERGERIDWAAEEEAQRAAAE